ncbi:transcriptional repressor [Kouleothrix sp.]|uniref:transcriptional repressor n=1 Tax=Kouleothrix sp. TaxID=2779161 RepID=UPI00391C2EE8
MVERAKSRHPSMSQATVYNTLAALEDLRPHRALDIVGEDHTHYDICVAPHVNVVCTRCGQIADVLPIRLRRCLAWWRRVVATASCPGWRDCVWPAPRLRRAPRRVAGCSPAGAVSFAARAF